MFKRKKGFTLLELMIVVIVIGILASLALPRFIEATRRAKESEARHVLGLIREAQFRYYVGNDWNYANSIAVLDLDLTPSQYYTYAPNAAPDPIATATAVKGSGLHTFTIDTDGTVNEGGIVW